MRTSLFTLGLAAVLIAGSSVAQTATPQQASTQDTSKVSNKDQEKQLKKNEHASHEQAKLAKQQRKALKQQDKANKAAMKADKSAQ